MSAQLTSFEGPDVQLLLDRIRTELGPDAKINGAEKIRVGGVLGFFAKEHYRVVVETPGTADAPLPSITEGLSDSIETSGAVSTSRRTTTSDVFSAMADATDDVNEVASASVTTSPTPLGTTSAQAHAVAGVPTTDAVAESFDDVLWRVATTLEPDPGASNGHDALTASADDFAGGAAAVGEPVLSAGDEHSGAAPDIASKAAQFLAATVVPPDGAGGGGGGGTGASAADTMVAALHRVGLGASMVHQLSEGLRLGGDLETLLLETLLLEAFGGLTPRRLCPGGPAACWWWWGPVSPPGAWARPWPASWGPTPWRCPSARATPGPTPWSPASCSCARPRMPPSWPRAGGAPSRRWWWSTPPWPPPSGRGPAT